jgi:hypothetical protein
LVSILIYWDSITHTIREEKGEKMSFMTNKGSTNYTVSAAKVKKAVGNFTDASLEIVCK